MSREQTDQPYDHTSRGISSKADCTPSYVLRLAKAKLVPHLIASDGTFLFQASAVAIVRQLKVEGLARRGGRAAHQPSAAA